MLILQIVQMINISSPYKQTLNQHFAIQEINFLQLKPVFRMMMFFIVWSDVTSVRNSADKEFLWVRAVVG